VRHRVIDLLPDRKAETAKVWLQAHPEIDVVSRDRGGDYASASRVKALHKRFRALTVFM
jgi:transposase